MSSSSSSSASSSSTSSGHHHKVVSHNLLHHTPERVSTNPGGWLHALCASIRCMIDLNAELLANQAYIQTHGMNHLHILQVVHTLPPSKRRVFVPLVIPSAPSSSSSSMMLVNSSVHETETSDE